MHGQTILKYFSVLFINFITPIFSQILCSTVVSTLY